MSGSFYVYVRKRCLKYRPIRAMLSRRAVLAAVVVAAIAAIAVHFALPPLSTPVRRVLVSPFVIVAAGLYWSLIAGLTSGHAFETTPQQAFTIRIQRRS